MARQRERQLGYSTLQAKMRDDDLRRRKGAKVARVVQHFLGLDSLKGLRVLDVGCSAGILADELRQNGAEVLGVDIDEPGLKAASERFGGSVSFVRADSEQLPLANACVDVVICNHVYEHVVDPDRLMRELRRIVRPDGVLYLGLGNKLGVMEPHYRLPFLSYLPRPAADSYVRAFGRAEHYHEEFRTRAGLRRLVSGLCVWDYTYPVLMEPDQFAAGEVVPRVVRLLPRMVLRALRPLVPTYVWVATVVPKYPQGPSLGCTPDRVRT